MRFRCLRTRSAAVVLFGLCSMRVDALPVFDVAPVSVHLGSVVMGTTGSADIVVTNVSAVQQTVNAIGVGGAITPPGSGSWGVGPATTQNCGSPMAPGGTCRLAVVFDPLALGPSAFAMNLLLTPLGGQQETFALNADAAAVPPAPVSVPVLPPAMLTLLAVLIGGFAGRHLAARGGR